MGQVCCGQRVVDEMTVVVVNVVVIGVYPRPEHVHGRAVHAARKCWGRQKLEKQWQQQLPRQCRNARTVHGVP